jgi:ketosteroid isomerase-like protein
VYEGHLANVALDFTYQVEQVLADSDLAVVRTTSHGTTTVRASGERSSSRARELFVLQREDGQWRIAQYMFQAFAEE